MREPSRAWGVNVPGEVETRRYRADRVSVTDSGALVLLVDRDEGPFAVIGFASGNWISFGIAS
jgi:hypothetical protein